MEQWSLSQTSFDQFLSVLDSNRDRAGQKYEALRIRIVKFFEWRACLSPEDLADETLDRIIRKIALGEHINDHVQYAYGVARFLYLETSKQRVKEQAIVDDMPANEVTVEDDNGDTPLDCLERCLKKLSETNRSMILHYYRDERQAKIDHRKLVAEKLNISVNALRIKALRIRTKLEECVLTCMNSEPA